MDPLTVGLVLGGGKMLYGLYEGYQAKKQAKAAQEAMVKAAAIPSSVYKMLGEAERNRNEVLPGEGILRSDLRESTQSGVSAVEQTATSSNQAVGALSDLFTSEQNSLRKLALDRARFQQGQEQQYVNALNTFAGYQQRQQNALMGIASSQYSDAMAQKQGGIQNVWSGASDILGSFAQKAASDQKMNELSKIYDRPSDALTQDGISMSYLDPTVAKNTFNFDPTFANWYNNGR